MIGIDFIAELQFLTTEQGSRKGYAKSGYRPHIEFENYPEYLTSGQQSYIGKEIVNPGDKIKAEIVILSTEYFERRLYEKMEFKFCEGSRIIGFGKIIEIINKNLKSAPNITQESINLNLYPIDIIDKIKSDYRQNWNKAFSEIQKLIISDESFRNNRIVRAIIHLGNKDIVNLEKVIEQAKKDWRDILLWSEYDKKEKRVRDFNNEFGNEEIKASR
ncbi:elongation factor Tu [Tenacibaculum aiptasiae]|uniref:elongation factor Tu n=1 Tax=Tenacibaculum aiptasiae TaxID=426481 RepID=UPI00232DD1C0|nr:elongation factor Tu [Tenacibaculum aiptasiae]